MEAIEVGKDGKPPRFAFFGDGNPGKFPATGLTTRDGPRRED